jgi:uncharacterized protein DUF4430
MNNVVQISIYADPALPPLTLPDVPWFAGITVLEAMVIGEAMHASNFVFRVEYRSIYGAQVDSIDGISDGDKPDHYWMFAVDGVTSQVGASEAILLEDEIKQSVQVEWRYTDFSNAPAAAPRMKTAAVGL